VTGSRIQIQSVKKRAVLRQLCQGAIKTGTSLQQTLVNFQAAIFSPTFQKGRIVVHQSGSGQSGSFQMGSNDAEWTQDNLFGLTEEFLSLYDTIQNNYWNTGTYTLPNGQPLPADDGTQDSINAWMQAMFLDDSLQGQTEQMGDWTGLNVPSLGGVPNAG
jgi:hypothetical protein